MNYCEDCGCRVFHGACTNCHEEIYIEQQNMSNDEPISFSDEFMDRLTEVKEEVKRKKIKA